MRAELDATNTRPVSGFLWTLAVVSALSLLLPTASVAQEPATQPEEEPVVQPEQEPATEPEEEPVVQTQEERIEALEKIVKEQDAEQQKGMTPKELEEFYEKTTPGSIGNYTAQFHLGKPRALVTDEGWWGAKGRPVEFRISGWAQLGLYHDFQGNALNNKQEFSSGAVLVPTLKVSSTGIDIGGSRFFVEIRHIFRGEQKRRNYPGVTHFLIVMDLGGGQLSLGYVTPRVRQFLVQHGNLTIGLALGTFANGASYPGWFDRGAPGAFTGASRQPVIRYAAALSKRQGDPTHVLTVAIEGAPSSFTNANSVNFNAGNFVLRYDYSRKWGNLMGAAIVRNLIAQSTVTAGQQTNQWVAGGTVTGWAALPTKQGDFLKWGFVAGPATSGYMFDTQVAGGLDGVYDDPTNSLATMMAWGAYGVWEHLWTEEWYSTFVLAYVDVVNIGSQAPDTLNNTITATASVSYQPWRKLFIAVEYFYGRRMNFDRQIGFDNRLVLAVRIVVNRGN